MWSPVGASWCVRGVRDPLEHLPEASLPYQPCITSSFVLILLLYYFICLAIMFLLFL